jgi:hypothetical protein
MSQKVIIDVQANTSTATANIEETTGALNKLTQSQENLDSANKQTASSFEDVTKNGGAIAILDQLTGGLASRVRDSYEATKLFNVSLKGMRTALIATGVGAFIVALGAVVAYWDEIQGLISGTGKKLDEFRNASSKTGTDLKILLNQVERNKISQEDLAKTVEKANEKYKGLNLALDEHGKLTKESTQAIEDQISAMEKRAFAAALEEEVAERQAKVIKEQLQLRKQASEEEIKVVRAMMEADRIAEEQFYADGKNAGIPFYGQISAGTKEDIVAAYIRDVDRAKDKVNELADIFGEDEFTNMMFGETTKVIEEKTEETETFFEKTQRLLNEKREFEEEARLATINTEKEIRAEELLQVEKQYEDLLQKARNYYGEDSELVAELLTTKQEKIVALETKFAEEDETRRKEQEDKEKERELEKEAKEEERRLQQEARQKKLEEDREKAAKKQIELDKSVQMAKLGIAQNTMNLIGQIAGEGSKLGKAMAIGQATISGYEGVQNAFTTAQDSPITIGFPAYPFIQAGLAGAFAAANIAKIASTKPTGSSGTGGLKATASAPQPQSPSFNIVGQGAGSQIAAALGQQQQQPVQAYVVSQDITTAQSLENGIIQGATLGG